MLGLLIGTDHGLLELVPGERPRHAFSSPPVTSIDYRDGVALAVADGVGAWRHDGVRWQQVYEGSARCARIGAEGTLYLGLEPADLVQSRDGGETWSAIEHLRGVLAHERSAHAPRGHADPYVAGLVFPAGGLLVGIAGAGAWFTRDEGANWLRRSEGLDPQLHRMWEHPERPDRLYASTRSGFYRSDDGGFTWIQSLAGLDRSWAGDAAILPGTPDRLLLAGARRDGREGALFVSANAGVSWTRVYLNEEDEFGEFARAPLVSRVWDTADTVFALADGSVFGSHDAGRRWVALAEGLPPAHALAAAL